MSIKYNCDMCEATVPVADQLLPVMIGETKVTDVCITCGSKLEQQIKQAVIDGQNARAQAQQPIPTPPPEQPLPTVPTPPATSDISTPPPALGGQ
ncbi:MAG: hypothetical protein ACTSQY_03230 [Candidatus Odinarchaeia archaeon]